MRMMAIAAACLAMSQLAFPASAETVVTGDGEVVAGAPGDQNEIHSLLGQLIKEGATQVGITEN